MARLNRALRAHPDRQSLPPHRPDFPLKRLVIHFERFGPYHLARITSAHTALQPQGWEVVGLETAASDDTYAWREELGPQPWQRLTAFPGESAQKIPRHRLRSGIESALQSLQPQAVAIAGWGSVDARACLSWCRRRGVASIVMSETREADGRRVWWKEWLKRRLVRGFDGGLVGARSHREYLCKLGLAGRPVATGYNVVDNDHFRISAARASTGGSLSDKGQAAAPYFLASNRFVERKNLATIIDAYARYVSEATPVPPRARDADGCSPAGPPWNLCLLGDGELREKLRLGALSHGLNVSALAPWEMGVAGTSASTSGGAAGARPSGTVFMPGFKQIDELARFYAQAGCFVHPALEEPWGLVINEAMAAGLPILCSTQVGAAEELLVDGVNGWRFDPRDAGALASLMSRVASPGFPLADFGRESQRIVDERAPLSAFGHGLSTVLALLNHSESSAC